MGVERPGPTHHAVAPHVAEQLGLREHAIRFARKRQQELVLLLRQLQPVRADAGITRSGVDANRRRIDDQGRRWMDPPQHRADSLDELLVLERRREVVVATPPERPDPIDRIRLLAAEHDHGRSFRPLLDARDVARQHEVGAALRADELEAVLRKLARQEAVRLGLGVGDEERGGGRHEPTVARP